MIKNTISLCMIVKNEEKVLKRCLESVKNVVDEIIIVDTGSSDKTIEIAKDFNAKIYYFDWIDDFSAARNYSIMQATCDYILILDADEYLDETQNLKHEILTYKDYYKMKIKNFRSDYDLLTSISVRLFKNGIGLYYENKLHEHLNIYNTSINFSGEDINTIIYHLGYLEEFVQEKNKAERNYRIMRREVEENPNGYSYYNMGIILYNQEKYEEAFKLFEKAYPLSKNKSFVMPLIKYMGLCMDKYKRTEDAISLLLNGIKAHPDYIDFYYTLGNMYKDISYYRDAEICYNKCLSLDNIKQNTTSEDGVGSFLANYRLAELYAEEGKLDVAFDYAFKSITENKNFRPALLIYIKLMLQANISLNETYHQITQIYSTTNFNDLKNLLFVLYDLRHPLLIKYINNESNVNDRENIAIALQYAKRYEEAKEEWKKVNNIPEKNSNDVVLLALILRDGTILDKIKNNINLSKKEWKVLTSIILRENFDYKQQPAISLERILLDIAEKLIILNEFDVFQYISGLIMACSKKCQYNLARLLIGYGFSDVALELLLTIKHKFPNEISTITLLSDILIKKGSYSEALTFLTPFLNITKDYTVYYQAYVAYEKLGNTFEKVKIKKEMKKLFPLSIYLNS